MLKKVLKPDFKIELRRENDAYHVRLSAVKARSRGDGTEGLNSRSPRDARQPPLHFCCFSKTWLKLTIYHLSPRLGTHRRGRLMGPRWWA
jgi:hypothetical protein